MSSTTGGQIAAYDLESTLQEFGGRRPVAEESTGAGGPPAREKAKERLDGLRPPLGAVFLAAYVLTSFLSSSLATAVFLATGCLLLVMSVVWASAFHKALAAAGSLALGALLLSGKFDTGTFLEGLPVYFNIVAVLMILSVAGYPIRAARFTAQIRALLSAATGRGVGVRTTSGILGHVLGAVLDVGSFVLIDVILRRAAPEGRIEALTWAGRTFSFTPLWANLNVFTATTVELTGASYAGLLAVSLPFVILGLTVILLLAQRKKDEVEEAKEALSYGAVAVLLYPVLLVVAVALVNAFFPGLSLTAAISVTVAAVVVLISALATALLRQSSPLARLTKEARESLVQSHAEFALFGSAGILVVSLEALGALAPVGEMFSSLPPALVAPALALVMSLGFVAGIHVLPLVLLINTAFPLSDGPAPALWAVAILLGAQTTILLTPFSNSTTMLARLTGLHPLEIGTKRNWEFGLILALAAAAYLGLLTLLLL